MVRDRRQADLPEDENKYRSGTGRAGYRQSGKLNAGMFCVQVARNTLAKCRSESRAMICKRAASAADE